MSSGECELCNHVQRVHLVKWLDRTRAPARSLHARPSVLPAWPAVAVQTATHAITVNCSVRTCAAVPVDVMVCSYVHIHIQCMNRSVSTTIVAIRVRLDPTTATMHCQSDRHVSRWLLLLVCGQSVHHKCLLLLPGGTVAG
jgi:hypothetical protein